MPKTLEEVRAERRAARAAAEAEGRAALAHAAAHPVSAEDRAASERALRGLAEFLEDV